MSEEKEKQKSNQNKAPNSTKEIFFETTYEKVLFILNKIKDFIKTISEKETSKLTEEIEWVIKVITNRSLYTYELIKEKIIKQNEEYDKYLNFVKKYNEEVIEMNKKHDIVSSILSIRKKEDTLLKPSLFLQKIENINKVGEIPDKNKSSFVTAFGNYILKLYEQNKKENNTDKNLKNNKEENENNNVINESINENGEQKHIQNSDKKGENKNINNSPNNKNNDTHKSNITNQKKLYLDNSNIPKQKIPNIRFNSNIKEKLINNNKELIRLTRAEKNNLNQIKNLMKNYYLNYPFNGHLMTSSQPYIFQSLLHNNYQKNLMYLKLFKSGRNTNLKTYNLYKTVRPNPITYNMNMKNKYNHHKNNKISLSLQTYNDSIEERFDLYNLKTSKNNNKTISPNKLRDNKENLIKKNNQITKQNNRVNKNLDNNVKDKNKSVPLDTLVNDYLDQFELITSLDFDIFELKNKVGYSNVLPLMGYIMLKTMGLVDNKIITTKKLEPFLKAVSDNYKITTLYHNSMHGADITQSLFVFFLNSNLEEVCETTVLDLLGLLISAMGHDIGHPGLNNGYHINASTELGITYNDKSCLENFHASFLFKILKKDETNILEKFSVQNYKTIRKRMISQILATDMAFHGETLSLVRAKISPVKDQERFIFLTGNDKTKFEEQQSLLNFLIHIADLGHNTKKFSISIKWIKVLTEEFWMQGDKERERGLPISFLCDRNNVDVPTSQIGFLKGFIVTSFSCLVDMFPSLKFTVDNAEDNIKQWIKFQKEKRLLGWTPEKDRKNKKEEEGEYKKI